MSNIPKKQIIKLFSSWTPYEEKLVKEWERIYKEFDLSDVEIIEIEINEKNENVLKEFKVTSLPTIIFNRKYIENDTNHYFSMNGIINYETLSDFTKHLLK